MNDLDESTLLDIELTQQQMALQRKRLRWEQSKPVLLPILRALIAQGIEPTIRDDDFNVCFAGDAAKLHAALDVIVAAGFTNPFKKPPQPGDVEWRAFFDHPASQLRVWLSFTSSVCVRKKVGTKMVEQDVFETICGDCTVESMQLPAPAPVLEEIAF